jgi:hypothetical protein
MSSVAVLFVPGRAGANALSAARDLAAPGHATITVVGEVPRAPSARRCGCSPREYNRAVAEQVADDLSRARTQLEELGQTVEVRLLVEGVDPPFREFVAAGRFDHALLARTWRRRIKNLGRRASVHA